jgi:hypothetical protein
VFSNSNLLILDFYNHLGVDSICVIEYIKSWEKVDVDNILLLAVINKLGLDVGGYSARRLAGHLLKNPALRAGGRALSTPRPQDSRAGPARLEHWTGFLDSHCI